MLDRVKEMPRNLAHYADKDNTIAQDFKAYSDAANVEAVVLIDRAHYDQGKQWAFEGETVRLTESDAAALERAGHVRVVAKRDPKKA